jgi:hypothetical protein
VKVLARFRGANERKSKMKKRIRKMNKSRIKSERRMN